MVPRRQRLSLKLKGGELCLCTASGEIEFVKLEVLGWWTMKGCLIGKGHNLLSTMIYNLFSITSKGAEFLEIPHSIIFPVSATNLSTQ